MSDMDALEFSSMIEETNVNSQIFEYWKIKNSEKKELIAVCLTDTNKDGLSMVYSFYDPKYNSSSLGKFMILDHINLTKTQNLNYLYLGYWIRQMLKWVINQIIFQQKFIIKMVERNI